MKHHQCICTKKKCPTISTVVATIFITSSWALLSQTCAFSNLHYAPQEKALLHRLMMSSIPSSPDIESKDQKSSAEKRWRSDIISSSTVNSRDEAYTTPTEKAPLDFFSAMFGNQPLSTSLPTNVLTAVDETKRQPEMWDYIQAALAPYYEAVYGLQESLKFKFSIASSQNQLPLHKRVLKVSSWLLSDTKERLHSAENIAIKNFFSKQNRIKKRHLHFLFVLIHFRSFPISAMRILGSIRRKFPMAGVDNSFFTCVLLSSFINPHRSWGFC